MERWITFLVLTAIAISAIHCVDQEFLGKQKFFYEILRHVHQPISFVEYKGLGDSYVTDKTKYSNVSQVEEFFTLETSHDFKFLAKGEIFSLYNDNHLRELKALYSLFYNSIDWPTLYTNILWARQHKNADLFVYVVSVTVTHRKDLSDISLPAIHEILPNYFFTSDVLAQGLSFVMQGKHRQNKVYTVYTNYTNVLYNLYDKEHRLSYFREDIGVNSYYYWFHIDYPFWMDNLNTMYHLDRLGEQYLYMSQQLVARYYLERLSNGLGVVPDISVFQPMTSGYNSGLVYNNGKQFSSRPQYYNVQFIPEYRTYVHEILELNSRITHAVETGKFLVSSDSISADGTIEVSKSKQMDLLGRIVGGFKGATNVYYKNIDKLVKQVWGGAQIYNNRNTGLPSALEHYQTTMRDPAWYQIQKRLVNYWYDHKSYEPYTTKQLDFPGLAIKSVTTKPFITYFDYFESDISNAIDIDESPIVFDDKVPVSKVEKYYLANTWNFKVLAKQKRLNHIPFSIKIDVESEAEVNATIRIFLGPKYDEFGKDIPLSENRKNFVELDQFIYQVPVGQTTIKRSTESFQYNVKDFVTYFDLYQSNVQAIENSRNLISQVPRCGWPCRLTLPKGTPEGLPYQLFVIITKYKPTIAYDEPDIDYKETYQCGVGNAARYLDDLPFGFPFDRTIDVLYFNTTNMFFKDVVVQHKLNV